MTLRRKVTTTLQLQEWSEVQDVGLSFEEIDALRRVAGTAIAISPGRRRDTWNLKASSYAGAIRVGELAVLIRPKIPLENLFYMLSGGQADIDFGTSLVGFEEHELMPALAAFYERLVADTLKRGVLSAYREHNEVLVALRGRVDMPAVLRAGGMPAPIPCRFDELSVDIAENQILRTAALALATFPDVAPEVRRGLRRTVGVLDGVASVDPRAVPPINLTRLNSYYEPALRMAELILRSGGVRDRAGALEASTFLIDMNHLFERFVTLQLRRLLAGKLEVRDQMQTHLDIGRKIPMRPDLVFYRRGEPVLVADIKYKVTEDGIGRNADYYQLLAYCQAYGVGHGVLIYARDEDVAANSASIVRGGPTFRVEPVDLSGGRKQCEQAMVTLGGALSALPLSRVT
jgi:5-methylcytosine-specific restriction enzyme subunit McrC